MRRYNKYEPEILYDVKVLQSNHPQHSNNNRNEKSQESYSYEYKKNNERKVLRTCWEYKIGRSQSV